MVDFGLKNKQLTAHNCKNLKALSFVKYLKDFNTHYEIMLLEIPMLILFLSGFPGKYRPGHSCLS